jgi:hypothetical protein
MSSALLATEFFLVCLPAKLLLVLASAAILGCESHGTHDHIFFPDSSGRLQTAAYMREREREREESWGVVVRDTTVWRGVVTET